METVSSKKHSVFSLVHARGTWQERLPTRPSTYLGGCRKAGLPGASRSLSPERTGPRETAPPHLSGEQVGISWGWHLDREEEGEGAGDGGLPPRPRALLAKHCL